MKCVLCEEQLNRMDIIKTHDYETEALCNDCRCDECQGIGQVSKHVFDNDSKEYVEDDPIKCKCQ